MPPPPVLRAIRNDIYHDVEEFKEILQNEEFKNNFGGLWGEKLTGSPKGFPKEFPDIELLKYKNYNVYKEIKKRDIKDKDFLFLVSDVFKTMLPFIRFLNHAIESVK